MTAFASPDDLEILSPGIDSALAQLLLDLVSDEIRAELGWSVSAETDQVLVTNGAKESPYLFVPTLRLTEVTDVTEDGIALVADTDYVWDTNGTVTRVRSGYPVPWCDKPLSVEITYDHGYAADLIPGVFRSVALQTAAGMADNPSGLLKSKTVGQISWTYADGSQAPPPSEDPRFSRYLLRDGIA